MTEDQAVEQEYQQYIKGWTPPKSDPDTGELVGTWEPLTRDLFCTFARLARARPESAPSGTKEKGNGR